MCAYVNGVKVNTYNNGDTVGKLGIKASNTKPRKYEVRALTLSFVLIL